MSNAARGAFSKGDRNSSKLYKERGQREKNKARRIARDKARANPLPCGHGSRHQTGSGYCRKCGRPA